MIIIRQESRFNCGTGDHSGSLRGTTGKETSDGGACEVVSSQPLRVCKLKPVNHLADTLESPTASSVSCPPALSFHDSDSLTGFQDSGSF